MRSLPAPVPLAAREYPLPAPGGNELEVCGEWFLFFVEALLG